ncbi:MAG TPA: biotin--[acetyl-CoA-carboxylase] ligase [Candidatus Udaeobacter sp.]|nr:biotin--[acetyl-CoA-carboxylase] ligase [Candidatus Udaeobacter sp.]
MFQAETSDRLIADELQTHSPHATIGRQIIVLQQTSSTNDAILETATTNSNPGLVLFAEHQTAGRGQRGNRWESAAGKGLWFSILLRPGIQIDESGRLTIWAIEAVSDVIRTEFSLEPGIKLPNDVRLSGRKVAGVLVEMRAQEKAPHLAVVGIGINVNQSLEDFPPELQSRAVSLGMALGRPVDRRQLAVALLRYLDKTYRERFTAEALQS